MLRHRYLPASLREPTGLALKALIDGRERRWIDAVAAGGGELDWIEVNGVWHSSPLRVDGLAIAVTPWANVQLARLLGVRLTQHAEALDLLEELDHVDPIKVTYPKGHPLHLRTSASDEAIAMVSDWLAEIELERGGQFNPNASKWWLDELADAELGDEDPVNFGLADPTAPYNLGRGIKGWQPQGKAHNSRHVDCSQGARFASSTEPGERPNLEAFIDLPDAWRLPNTTLAERTVGWLGTQFGLGVREIPGARHDPRILAYSKHCARGGRFLGVRDDGQPIWADGAGRLALYRDEDPWCAATASESLRVSLYPGEAPPHGLRVAVRELVEDAGGSLIASRKGWANSWRDLQGYTPKPGDLAILGRAGESPRRGGRGHVRTVVQVLGPDTYLAIGGNEGNKVTRGVHRFDHALLEGWIAR